MVEVSAGLWQRLRKSFFMERFIYVIIVIIKVALIIWISFTVYRWYQRLTENGKGSGAAAEATMGRETGPVHTGRIEDAEFEEMDGGPDRNR